MDPKDDDILSLFDKYFETASKEEIAKDVAYINSISSASGVTFEEYLENLNAIAAIPLAGTDICDDIVFSDFFNDLISKISMDDASDFQRLKTTAPDCLPTAYSSTVVAGESLYAMAA